MFRKLLILAGAVVLLAPIAAALANRGKPVWSSFPRGDLLVTFTGTGGGGYRFHAPASGSGASCHSPDTVYAETDAYSWRASFVVGPSGGTSDAPLTLAGAGQLTGSEQLGPCGANDATSTTCAQSLHAPPLSSDGDVAYPGVAVVLSGKLVTVGAISELLRNGAPSCDGPGGFEPNVVTGYTGLQASVSFPRALLARTGDYRAPFSMPSSGLYAGVTLNGSCNSTSCAAADCSQDLPPSGGASSTCSFGETYSGTIEVRVIR
jgi:hypothetical protein